MSRFFGKVGFAKLVETRPGIFTETYIERPYKGDLLKRSRNWSASDYLNDNLEISNEISLISDSFMDSNFGTIRYVKFKKQAFRITSANLDTERHRITLSIGGVFNVPESTEDTEG